MENSLNRFFEYLEFECTVSPHTLRNYMSDINKFYTFIKDEKKLLSWRDLTPLTIRSYLGHLYKQNSKSSIARKLSTIKHFLHYLTREKVIEKDFSDLLSSPKQEKKLPEVLNVDEMFHLLETPDPSTHLGKRDRALLELLYATGIRVSELVGINLEDITWENQTLRVRGKGRKERIVPFGEKAKTALKIYMEERPFFYKKRDSRIRGNDSNDP